MLDEIIRNQGIFEQWVGNSLLGLSVSFYQTLHKRVNE